MSSQLTASGLSAAGTSAGGGVFLFHPRMLQRLIRRHLGDASSNSAIPLLRYYLIPREILLIGLEDENPDALSVIEGLNLPDWVILLPMPSAPGVGHRDSRALVARLLGSSVRGRGGARLANGPQRQSGSGLVWRARLGSADRREGISRGAEPARTGSAGRAGFGRRNAVPSSGRVCDLFALFHSRRAGLLFPAVRDWGGLDRWLKIAVWTCRHPVTVAAGHIF